MKKMIVASNNEHKIKEIKEILKSFNIEIISQKQAGIDIDVEENKDTFEGNAMLKASAIHNLKNDCMVLADDSGLMVDALNGAPGVYSARFAGEHGNSKKNNEKLLSLLKDVPEKKRNAKFVCAIAVILEDGKTITAFGEVHGRITYKEEGNDGFGYDPIFYVPNYKCTFAQMNAEQKNAISHRGRALENLEKKLKEYFNVI